MTNGSNHLEIENNLWSKTFHKDPERSDAIAPSSSAARVSTSAPAAKKSSILEKFVTKDSGYHKAFQASVSQYCNWASDIK